MDQVSTQHSESRPLARRTSSPSPRHGTILVIEDHDDVRTGLVQLLALRGYSVAGAADAEDALDFMAGHSSDLALLLLDLLLPGRMDGRDLRALQLANPELSDIPTVVVSACEPNPDVQSDLTPNAWLEKPFRGDQLLAIVSRFVIPGQDQAH
jgi:CheY-like chemotaxis protein